MSAPGKWTVTNGLLRLTRRDDGTFHVMQQVDGGWVDAPNLHVSSTALHEAADRYRAAVAAAHNAATRSRLTRLDHDATQRQVADANQASLDARRALEHARDELVAAALEHTGV